MCIQTFLFVITVHKFIDIVLPKCRQETSTVIIDIETSVKECCPSYIIMNDVDTVCLGMVYLNISANARTTVALLTIRISE